MKISIIIPSTSLNKNWQKIEDCFLYKSINSFLKTKSEKYQYKFFIGHEKNDKFYTTEIKNQFITNFDLIEINFFENEIEHGHITKMWNLLAREAQDWGADYMYQCGDDVQYSRPGWVEASVLALEANDNMGLTGPRDIGNPRILTQCFVSKKHMDIFGWFFPEEIKNWFCDDWINEVYNISQMKFAIPEDFFCSNNGGEPRYSVVHCRDLCNSLVARDLKKIADYIKK